MTERDEGRKRLTEYCAGSMYGKCVAVRADIRAELDDSERDRHRIAELESELRDERKANRTAIELLAAREKHESKPLVWQDAPTEPGWYWVQHLLDYGPCNIIKGIGDWEVFWAEGSCIGLCLCDRKVMPIPEPDDA